MLRYSFLCVAQIFINDLGNAIRKRAHTLRSKPKLAVAAQSS